MQAFSGNFSSVAKDFLEKAGKNDGKFTYSVDGHTFNFLTRAGYSKRIFCAGFASSQLPPLLTMLVPNACSLPRCGR